jgi:hypothetical protein
MNLAGATLKIDYGFYNHYGIADGFGNVIHNSKKYLKVVKETEEAFSEGRDILSSNITSANPSKAVVIASRYLKLPYNLLSVNCEHFVRLSHGLDVESTQVQQYLALALGAGIAISSKNKNIQLLAGGVSVAVLLTPSEENPFKNIAVALAITAGVIFLVKAMK